MDYVSEDDLKVLQKHGLNLRFTEKSEASAISSTNHSEKEKNNDRTSVDQRTSYSFDENDFLHADSPSPSNGNNNGGTNRQGGQQRHEYYQSLVTTEFTKNNASNVDSSDVAYSLSTRNYEKFANTNKIYNQSLNAKLDNTVSDDDLERQLKAAHERLSMLEKMFQDNNKHYRGTMNILENYQNQLNDLHNEATKQSVGYHVPAHVARAKEKVRLQNMAFAHAKKTAELTGKLREYEQTIYRQQQEILIKSQQQQERQTEQVQRQNYRVQQKVQPLSSCSPSARAARVLNPPPPPPPPLPPISLEPTPKLSASGCFSDSSSTISHPKVLPIFTTRLTNPPTSSLTMNTMMNDTKGQEELKNDLAEYEIDVQSNKDYFNTNVQQKVIFNINTQKAPMPSKVAVKSVTTNPAHVPLPSSSKMIVGKNGLHREEKKHHLDDDENSKGSKGEELKSSKSFRLGQNEHQQIPKKIKGLKHMKQEPVKKIANTATSRWAKIREEVVYKRGSIRALRGKDDNHLYHPKTYKKRSSISVDYEAIKNSSEQLKGAVSFALAALKESGKAAKRDDGNNDDDDDDEENTTVGVQLANNQKVWDVTGELLKRIGIAGMINVQVSMKRWAKRAGIKRPLHFSRKLGSRMRRSSTILSPLARKTLDEASKTGKILSSEARTKIKMRAVRAAAAGDLVKRKKFLKSIALFQNFSEAVLDGIAKSLDYVVFIRGDVIIEQGAPGLKLFIIEKGSVDIFVAEPGYDPSQHTPSEPGLPVVGRKVMRLSSGDPFGERALMQSKPRGATCVAVENTTCFVLDRERFLQAIESIEIFDGFGYEDRDRSDVLALGRHIDKFQRMQTSFEEMRKQQQKVDHDSRSNGTASTATGGGSTKNSPTDDKLNLLNPAKKKISARSSIVLESDDDSSEDSNSEDEDDDGSEKKDGGKHITGSSLNEADKEAIDGGLKLQDGLLHLMSAFSPECDDNDTTERIIKTMYRLCRVERIGLFLCDWKKEQLVLSIARKNGARGIRIPMKGIAGNVARNGKCVNVLDAYKEPLFNSTMDQETGFKTKTILAIPIRSHVLIDKKRGENYGKNLVLGVIQLINKKSGRVFKNRDVQLLITVAEMLGHNLDRKQKNGEIQNSKATETISATPVSNINKQIKINVTNCSKILMKYNKNDKKVGKLRLEVQLFHGGEPLCDAESTPLVPATCINSACSNGPLRTLVRKNKNTENTNNLDDNGDGETKENNDKKENDENLRLPEGLKLIKNPGAYDYDFHQTLILNFRVRNIPAAALLCITLWEGKGHSKPRGWGGMRLFGYDKSMAHGKYTLKLCPYTIGVNPCSTTINGDRLRLQVISTVDISFDEDLPNDVKYNDDIPVEDLELGGDDQFNVENAPKRRNSLSDIEYHDDFKPTKEEYNVVKSRLNQLAGKDPLYKLSREDKNLLWQFREYVMDNDTLLPKLLRSIDWGNRAMVQEGYRVMYAWEQPRPIVALTMLNDHFPDPKVRGYASLCLERMKDETLSQYILQLTQTLKHEPFHDSGLARFLLRRAIRNTRLLGHQLFWSLKAEMHDPLVSDRYGVLLDMYRRNCGSHRGELGHQLFLMRQLQNCSDIVKPLKKEERKAKLKERLDYVNQQLRDVDVFQLPLDPHMVSTGIVVEKSRVMGSKQAPIWLTFENAIDPSQPHVVMFKAGDDLRQDQLTLQVIHVMDTLWQAEGFDFRINDYKCVSTGWEQGMLQIVQNAATVAMIIADGAEERTGYKGKKLARQAAKDAMWRKHAIADWLMEQAKNFDPKMWNGEYGTEKEFYGGIGKKVRRSIMLGGSQNDTHQKNVKKSLSFSPTPSERTIYSDLGNSSTRRLTKASSSHNFNGTSGRKSTHGRATSNSEGIFMKSDGISGRALTKSDRLAKASELLEHNFMMSCAGYIAATYVLGIGDRHNDNYMIRKDGCFFHIDFGHFLGNFKSKFGIKRETMPFIFTEQMKFAIGKRFNEFESLACDAYKTLRRHANLLITMFSLMVSSGMPELMTDEDIGWLRDKLMLDCAEDQAANDFKKQIEAAYKNKRVKMNDVAHLLRHVG